MTGVGGVGSGVARVGGGITKSWLPERDELVRRLVKFKAGPLPVPNYYENLKMKPSGGISKEIGSFPDVLAFNVDMTFKFL